MHGFYFYKDYGTKNCQNDHAYCKDGMAIHCVDLQEVSTNNQKAMYKILRELYTCWHQMPNSVYSSH